MSERIRLLRQLCDAVEHALQHRVIHRDLKPGDILVTGDGRVKLLDFGIAKLARADSDQQTLPALAGGYSFPLWGGQEIAAKIITCASVLALLYFGALISRWVFRRRWAGSLLLSIPLTDQPAWAAAGVNLLVSLLAFPNRERDWYFTASFIGAMAAILLFTIVVSPHLELRERGLICRGRLISWLDLEGYTWEPARGRGALTVLSITPVKDVLQLRVRRLFSVLPPVRVSIPREYHAELEAVLKQHLGEWPPREG